MDWPIHYGMMWLYLVLEMLETLVDDVWETRDMVTHAEATAHKQNKRQQQQNGLEFACAVKVTWINYFFLFFPFPHLRLGHAKIAYMQMRMDEIQFYRFSWIHADHKLRAVSYQSIYHSIYRHDLQCCDWLANRYGHGQREKYSDEKYSFFFVFLVQLTCDDVCIGIDSVDVRSFCNWR